MPEAIQAAPQEQAPAAQTPAPVVEQPPAQAPTPTPEPQASQALRSLLAKEKELRVQQEALKSEKQLIEEARNERELLKKNPLAYLEKQGIKYEDLTKQIVEQRTVNPNKDVERKLSTLEQELQRIRDRDEAIQREATMREATQAVKAFIDTSEDFPLTKDAEMHQSVLDTILDAYETGVTLSEHEASKIVEGRLAAFLDRVMKNEKVRSKYIQSSPQQPVTTTSSDQRQAPVTLENNLHGSGSVKTRADFNSKEEWIQYLAKKHSI